MFLRPGLIAFLLTATLFVAAQNKISDARKEMELYNYSKALDLLQKTFADGNDKSKCETSLLLAECYHMLNDIANAKTWYEKALGKPDGKKCDLQLIPITYFHYAQALRSSGEFKQAKRMFLMYDSLVPGDLRGRQYAVFCDSAIQWQRMLPGFVVMNAKALNSAQSEFGPVLYQKGIIFTSDRITERTAGNTYGWTGNSYLDLYFSEPLFHDTLFGEFRKPKPVTALGDQAWHEGPVCFNQGFTEAFINRTQVKNDKGKKDHGHITTHLLKLFTSSLKDGTWSKPAPFLLNNDEYSVGHPSLSPDGQTFYFVSDMPGGFGETDIYYCHREGMQWSKPLNLGAVVNTPGKEMFPFIAGNGDLYFASDGLPGFGGLDIYVTRKMENTWATPQNLGQPVNSSYDDFSLIIEGTGEEGLFSSNRPGGFGSDDIYCFRKISPEIQKPPVTVRPATVIIKSKDTLQMNRSYTLENILYDFDKWDIRADAKPSLDKLVKIMNEYPVSVELGSHTDCRGTEQYNLELSQKRAESAVQYIISQGIASDRITAKGYGKSQLLNGCNCEAGVVCTDAEHQANRRTVFRITGK